MRRGDFLDQRCGRDSQLRARIEKLIGLEQRGELSPPPGLPSVDQLAPRAAEGARFGPRPGDRIGAYELSERVGFGGMGEVWRARRADGQFEREVAIKFVRFGLAREELLRRFERERKLLARLQHPHIATLLDGGVEDEVPYLVMEFVEGEAITEHAQARELDVEARLDLFCDVAEAVSYAHGELVVHRDLKPGNVLVTAEGRVVLLDFGIAKLLDEAGEEGDLTRPSERVLTPRYASPEQLAGENVTTLSDVYALGLLLHELLAGRHPFEDELELGSHAASLLAGREAPPVSDSAARSERPATRGHATRLRGDLDTIVGKALHGDSARRYRSVESLLEDLRRHREGLPVQARPDTWTYRATKFARRNRLALAAAAAVLLTLSGALAWTLHLLERANWADLRAERETELQARLLAHLEDSLQLSHPELAQSRLRRSGREEALAELEREFAALEGRYADAPEVEGRLRAKAARLVFNLGRPEEARRHLERSRELLEGRLPPGDPDLLRCEKLRCDLLRLQGRGDEALAGLAAARASLVADSPEAERLELELRVSQAACLNQVGRAAEARSELEALLPLAARVHGEQSPHVLSMRSRLAGALYQVGEVEAAEREAERARDGLLAALGEDHLLVAESRRTLAKLHVHARRRDEALAELGAALPVLEEWAMEDDPLLLGARVDHAWAEHLGGRSALALEELEGALAALERTLGPDSRRVLDARNYRAGMLAALGRVGEGLEQARANLAQLEERPELASTMTWFNVHHTLGALLVQTVKFAEAERVFRSFVELRARAQGAGHPQTLASFDGLGQSLVGLGRNEQAEELYREIVASSEDLDRDSYWSLSYRARLGYVLWLQGEFEEVEALARELLPRYEALPGHERLQEYGVTLDILASSLERSARAEEAVPIYERSLALKEAAGSRTRWDALGALEGLGRALTTLDRDAEAEAVLRTLVQRAARNSQIRTANRLRWRIAWASRVARVEGLEDAERILRETNEIVETELGADSLDAVWCRALLGSHLLRTGELDESAWLLEEAYERLLEAEGPEHGRTRFTAQALARLLREVGEDERAAALERGSD